MHRNSSTLVPLGLVAAIGLGMPALAKSMQSGKTTTIASMRSAKTEKARALNAHGTIRRAPTFGTPNPNSPTLIGGSSGYNINLYVY